MCHIVLYYKCNKERETSKRKEVYNMTQKQILTLAADNELMSILEHISDIQANMIFKTAHEQKAAKQEMKHFAKIIIENLK